MCPLTSATISAIIVNKMVEGMTVAEAIDAMLGEGTFTKIASDYWERVRNEF